MFRSSEDDPILSIILEDLSEKEKLVLELLALNEQYFQETGSSPHRDVTSMLSTHLHLIRDKEGFKRYDQIHFYGVKKIGESFTLKELKAMKESKLRQLKTDMSKHEETIFKVFSFGKSLGVDYEKIVNDTMKESVEILEAEKELTDTKGIH